MSRAHSFLIGALAAVVGACGTGDISEQGARFVEPGNPADGVESGNPQAPNAPTIPSDPFPQDDPSCPDAAVVVTASNGWKSATASQPAYAGLQLSLMARPEAAGIDAVLAVGGQDISDFSDAAILVRFAENGLIDARDGSVYDRDSAFAYEPGVWYSIMISADVANQTYDVEVARCGEPPQTLITGAAFRSDAGISDKLTTWAAWSSQSAKLELATPSWVASGSCAPATCESLGLECGAPNDGCSGNLSCGGCGDGDACAAGTCVEVSSPSPSPPPPPPPGGGGLPGGLADDCAVNTALSGACVCGGSVYSSGFCCETGYSFSACSTRSLYVLPGGSGARNGTDWANAISGLPGTLERDTVYWLGAGGYGAYTFDDAASGSTGITIRKATADMHGTETGWSAGLGDGAAAFGPLSFAAGRYTMDGGEPGGIVVTYSGPMGGSSSAVGVDGDNVVLRNMDVDGGVALSGGVQTAGACSVVRVGGDNTVVDRSDLHDAADDGIEIQNAHGTKVFHSKIHALPACGTDGECSGPCFNGHSDGIEIINGDNTEIKGNMVYDILSTAAMIVGDGGNPGATTSNLDVQNNIFYTPATGLTVQLWNVDGLEFHNNVVWGRTQGDRYGGMWFGSDMFDVYAYNNIFVNINFTHGGGAYNASEHHLDYNLFGDLNTSEYPGSANDLVADPRFAGIPLSGNAADHKGSDLTLEDFVPAASEAIDTGTSSGRVPAYDIVGEKRPQGAATDRGVFEATP